MALRNRLSTLTLGAAVIGAAAVASCGSNAQPPGYGGPDSGSGSEAGPGNDGSPMLGSETGTFNNEGGGDGSMPPPVSPCDPTCAAAGGTCTNNVCVLNENLGNVNAGTQGQLLGGGMADSAFAFAYPYDKTVFPRGLLPPTLQFAGSAPDATYVHITFSGMNYQGFYGTSSPGRVTFSAPVWKAITLAAHAGDAVKVDVTKITGGQVSGPVSETWTIAQGSLRGTIYYETYDSQLAGGLGSVGIMQIQPGATSPTVIKSGCGNVCHTASADGSTLVAQTGFPAGSSSYDLKNNAATISAQGDLRFTYGGIYPDGSLVMSATHYRLWIPGASAPSGLYDTHTGNAIPAPGWDGVIHNGGTTAFSPDGKYLAFNHEDTGGGHTLAVMSFNLSTKAFSGLADIATDQGYTLAWPAFTPDSKWVVYHAGSNPQFETDMGATGDVFITDLASHTVHRLDALDGYTMSGSTYLPANDPGLSFAPTVLPEAVGGYFWVVFTSHRSYGNILPSRQNNDQDGKLWVAAIDLNGTVGKDVSHPAFYLDGQETSADNLRGFWVLSPCKADGSDCQSGDECCAGFCRNADASGLQCVPMPGGCSHEFERCTTAADCCDAGDQCINGRCARPNQ
jgi:hypothetical protein